MAPTGLTDEARIRIQGTIGESVQTLPWSDDVMPDSELKSEFNRCLEASDASPRVKKMIERLFGAHGYQTVKMD